MYSYAPLPRSFKVFAAVRQSIYCLLGILLSALLLRSSSFVDLPPTFCVSRVLACYASVWGPEYLWTIALYWGYKIRNLLEN